MIAQTILAGALVIAAAAWLVGRQLRPSKRGPSPCSGCSVKAQASGSSCPSCPGAPR